MKLPQTTVLAVTAMLALSACKQETTIENNPTEHTVAEQSFSVTAEVMYRERMLAPRGSSLTVTLEDMSIADKASTVLAEHIVGLSKTTQLPQKVSLTVPQGKLEANHSYALRAKLTDADGQLMWTTTEVQSVDTSEATDDLGQVIMQRVESGVVTNKVNALYPIPFNASGNEPGWSVEVKQNTIDIKTNYGQNSMAAPRPEPQPYKGGYKYHFEAEGKVAILDIQRKLCYDDMSGRPHPTRVTFALDGKLHQGCGGDPLELLVDVEWVVEDLANTGIIDSSRMTLNFDRKGRVHGLASCNSYSAGYELTGETLTLQNPLATLKACAPALMNQEQKFLALLSNVNRYDIDGNGALILTTKDGKTITARQ